VPRVDGGHQPPWRGQQGSSSCFDGEGSIIGTLALASNVEGSRGEPR
jgi:hypothetical protein